MDHSASSKPDSIRDLLDARAQRLMHQRAALHGQIAAVEVELADVLRAREALGMPPLASSGRHYSMRLESGSYVLTGNPAELHAPERPPTEGISMGVVGHTGVGVAASPLGVEAKGLAADIPPSVDSNDVARMAAERTRRHMAAVQSTTDVVQPPLPLSHPYQHMSLKILTLQALLDNFPEGATVAELREFFRNAYARDVERGSLSSIVSRLNTEGVLHRGVKENIWTLGPNSLEYLMKEYGIIPPQARMKAIEEELFGPESETATSLPKDAADS